MARVGAATRDPRSIITPEAFEVDPSLLGLPLATPWQRLWAILIDLVVIGVITGITKSSALILGVVAAVFFIRAGFKRTPVKGNAFGRAMRFSVGCLGLFIGILTASVWFFVHNAASDDDPAPAEVSSGAITVGSAADALQLLRGVGDLREFRRAPDVNAARAAAREVVHRAGTFGIPDKDLRGMLLEAVPEGAPWAADAELIVDEAMAKDAPAGDAPEPTSSVAGYTTSEALEAYARLLRSPEDTTAESTSLKAALRGRLLDEVAADTLRRLEEDLSDVEAIAASRYKANQELTAALKQEREGGSLFSWMLNLANQLGFGFGWAALYMAITLSAWKGQTVGKRMLKIRVLTLDGEPITWWTAFERAGGYAAGFATGLLGFAQVFWDANRQAIHDRIVGTVVVKDGAPKVMDWEEAL